MTNEDTGDSDPVEDPAVGCGGKTCGILFRRCFALMDIKIVLPMDGSVRKRNCVDAFTEMMRDIRIFKTYGRSRFKIQGPGDRDLYKVDTTHDFGNGSNFGSHWTTLEKGKELFTYKVCRYFGYPNPVEWLVKSNVDYARRQQKCYKMDSYRLQLHILFWDMEYGQG